MVLLLRGYEDIGGTVIGVLHRYTEALQANDGKLILAGVSPALRDQLQRTGMLTLIGEENIFPVTQTLGKPATPRCDPHESGWASPQNEDIT